jgi:hypothetical protein
MFPWFSYEKKRRKPEGPRYDGIKKILAERLPTRTVLMSTAMVRSLGKGGLRIHSFLVICVFFSCLRLEAAQPAKDDTAADVKKLVEKRVALAKQGYDNSVESFGQVNRSATMIMLVTRPEEVYSWSVRWLQADRELNPRQADTVAALERHLERMKLLEKRTMDLVPQLIPQSTGFEVQWYRLEAELWLAQAKEKK